MVEYNTYPEEVISEGELVKIEGIEDLDYTKYWLNESSAGTIMNKYAEYVIEIKVIRELPSLPDPNKSYTVEELQEILETEWDGYSIDDGSDNQIRAWVIDFENNLITVKSGKFQRAIVKVSDEVSFKKQ